MIWQIHHDCTKSSPKEVIKVILQNRGLTNHTAIDRFLHPPSPLSYTAKDIGIDETQLQTALSIIKFHINKQVPIIVFGDYDADGITATAILWETLHHLGAKTIPFIPSREQHGYGLSIEGLEDALGLVQSVPLIITVDNGIVANQAALWLKEKQIPLIITDHHSKGETIPLAEAIIHSTQISGAGVAWFLSKELSIESAQSTLELACIGTIADMMPLFEVNRSFAKLGLEALQHTSRPGLRALLSQADITNQTQLTTYHINYVIAPRLNATGRLEHALDSLRLICTKNPDRATILAEKLGDTNRTRQDLTTDLLDRAINYVNPNSIDPIIVVADENFHEGIIGLIAGKLVENFYRPSIVISQKQTISKASARSIKGVNITEMIRSQSHLLLGAGGHPMAAGFSIETGKIEQFKQSLLEYASNHLDKSVFNPVLEIDCAINESTITEQLYQQIQQLQPFGIGNHEPVIALHQVKVARVQFIGKTGNHLKITFSRQGDVPIQAIWFNPPQNTPKIKPGNLIDIAGIISQNTWQNKTSLQIILKDVQTN